MALATFVSPCAPWLPLPCRGSPPPLLLFPRTSHSARGGSPPCAVASALCRGIQVGLPTAILQLAFRSQRSAVIVLVQACPQPNCFAVGLTTSLARCRFTAAWHTKCSHRQVAQLSAVILQPLEVSSYCAGSCPSSRVYLCRRRCLAVGLSTDLCRILAGICVSAVFPPRSWLVLSSLDIQEGRRQPL